jgi:hypothetical protein
VGIPGDHRRILALPAGRPAVAAIAALFACELGVANLCPLSPEPVNLIEAPLAGIY